MSEFLIELGSIESFPAMTQNEETIREALDLKVVGMAGWGATGL